MERYLSQVIAVCPGAEYIVVDDASTDDSVAYVHTQFPEVIVVQKEHNTGFSSTVNKGVAQATRDLILLLNTDIEPKEKFLDTVFSFFEDETTFAVGLIDETTHQDTIVHRGRGVATFSRGMYVHAKGEETQATTAWVSCGSGVFRRSIWNELHGLDPVYDPFYWEDIDLSYRALAAGYTIYFDNQALVSHHHDIGAIKNNFSTNQVKRVAYRNQFLFHWRNLKGYFFLVHLAWIPYHILYTLFRGDFQCVLGCLDALKRFFSYPKPIVNSLRSDKQIFTLLPKE